MYDTLQLLIKLGYSFFFLQLMWRGGGGGEGGGSWFIPSCVSYFLSTTVCWAVETNVTVNTESYDYSALLWTWVVLRVHVSVDNSSRYLLWKAVTTTSKFIQDIQQRFVDVYRGIFWGCVFHKVFFLWSFSTRNFFTWGILQPVFSWYVACMI